MLNNKDKQRIAQMWSKINRNMDTEDRAAFSRWKIHLWLLADLARDFARLCNKEYVTDAVSDVFEEVNQIPILDSDPNQSFRNELKQVADVEQENAKLREALKKARQLAQRNGYTMREFSGQIGITDSQLSAWTDSTPTTEPDFKD
jgi:uncharacterized protein YdiU (UPF0061 family)